MDTPPKDYVPSFFDRHGPEAAGYMVATIWGVAMGIVALSIASVLNGGLTVGAIIVGVASGLLVGGLGPAIGHAFGSFWNTIAVSGGSTPGEPQFSYEQSLVMQGKVDEALRSLEAVIAGEPNAIRPRIFTAELYLRERNNAVRSAELLQEAQKIRPMSAGDDVYIANRLTDLYVGPLNTPAKALRELRRVIDLYGDTAAGEHARNSLATLKARFIEHTPPS